MPGRSPGHRGTGTTRGPRPEGTAGGRAHALLRGHSIPDRGASTPRPAKSPAETRRRPIGRSPPRVPSSAQGEDTSSRERRRCRVPATRSIRTVLAAPRNASEQVTHAHDHGGRPVRRARVRGAGQRRAALGDDRALPGHRPRRRGAGGLPLRRHRRRRAGAARRRSRPGRPPAGRRPAHHRRSREHARVDAGPGARRGGGAGRDGGRRGRRRLHRAAGDRPAQLGGAPDGRAEPGRLRRRHRHRARRAPGSGALLLRPPPLHRRRDRADARAAPHRDRGDGALRRRPAARHPAGPVPHAAGRRGGPQQPAGRRPDGRDDAGRRAADRQRARGARARPVVAALPRHRGRRGSRARRRGVPRGAPARPDRRAAGRAAGARPVRGPVRRAARRLRPPGGLAGLPVPGRDRHPRCADTAEPGARAR